MAVENQAEVIYSLPAEKLRISRPVTSVRLIFPSKISTKDKRDITTEHDGWLYARISVVVETLSTARQCVNSPNCLKFHFLSKVRKQLQHRIRSSAKCSYGQRWSLCCLGSRAWQSKRAVQLDEGSAGTATGSTRQRNAQQKSDYTNRRSY